MKSMYLIPVLCTLNLVGILCIFADQKEGDTKAKTKPIAVTIESLGYDPKKLDIHVGDSVVWTNKSRTTHSATSDDDGKAFDTGDIKPDKSSEPEKFEKEGEFKYHCNVHGKAMSGIISVMPAEK
ncbi:MAG: plastocyanin [Planctomycetaceae bacterium]|nr:plastocyanin [Planctomycetaceae bacterium]